jgi:hypothetical protein
VAWSKRALAFGGDEDGDFCGRAEVFPREVGGFEVDLKLFFDVQEELHDGHRVEACLEEVTVRREWLGRAENFILNDLE